MEILLRQFQTKSFLSICKCLEPAYSHATSWTSGNAMLGKTLFHTSNTVAMPYNPPKGPRKWPIYNKKIFAPQLPGEERRPAYVCHMRTNIKYSPFKMWYVASMIRGMSVDEAIKQLSFVNKQGAVHVKEVLLEAQKLAVEKHNVEFKSNLWVAESFATKGLVMKGIRRHAKGRVGLVHYFHCHYFVRLEEGSPPAHFFFETAPCFMRISVRFLLTRKISNQGTKEIFLHQSPPAVRNLHSYF